MDRTVAVTGGSKLGRAVVAALIEEGWTVVNSDRVPSPDSQPTSYARTSLRPGPEVIKIAVDHGVLARSAAPMPAATRRTLPSRLEPKPRRRPLVSWAWATRISTATRVVLDSTLTPAAVMIGGSWIG